MSNKYNIKSHFIKLSIHFSSSNPHFYLQPLLFLTDQFNTLQDEEDVIAAEYRLSNCQGVIFDHQQQCFFVDFAKLDARIWHLNLVLCAPPRYQFHTLDHYRLTIENTNHSNNIYLNSCYQALDKNSDFIIALQIVRHTRHTGWYTLGQVQSLFGTKLELYQRFGYQNYFSEPLLNVQAV